MDIKTSIKIDQTDVNSNKTSTTVSSVNPNASDNSLVLLGRTISNLTTNTYIGTTRTDSRELNGNKSIPTLTLASQPDGTGATNWGQADDTQGFWLYIVTNSDATPTIIKNTAYCAADIIREGDPINSYALVTSTKDPGGIWEEDTTYTDEFGNQLSKVGYVNTSSVTDQTARIVVKLPETDTFTSAEATVYVKY